jgi:hypothetical protein
MMFYGSEESYVINGSNMLKHVETEENHHGTPWRFLVGNKKSRLATSAAPDLISRSERQTSSAMWAHLYVYTNLGTYNICTSIYYNVIYIYDM